MNGKKEVNNRGSKKEDVTMARRRRPHRRRADGIRL